MFRSSKLLLCLCAAAASRLFLGAESIGNHEIDQQFLLKDVNHIWLSGNPGWFSVFGDNAFPLVASRTSAQIYRTLMAGGRYGKGRIIAAAHSSFVYTLTPPVPMDRDQLLLNAINWLSPGQRATKIATVGNFPSEVNSIITSKGIELSAISWLNIANSSFVAGFDVLLLRDDIPKDVVPHLLSYLQLDRGLLISTTAWSTGCCKNGEPFASAYPNNVITSKAGFVWAREGGSLPTTPMRTYNTSVTYLKYLHYNHAIKYVTDHAHGVIEKDGKSLNTSLLALWDTSSAVFGHIYGN